MIYVIYTIELSQFSLAFRNILYAWNDVLQPEKYIKTLVKSCIFMMMPIIGSRLRFQKLDPMCQKDDIYCENAFLEIGCTKYLKCIA